MILVVPIAMLFKLFSPTSVMNSDKLASAPDQGLMTYPLYLIYIVLFR
jgi:hypothetical protein